ncbi:MAG: 5'/3'-nucleotidase SurE [Clostridia bacterium]|nr:5'/3'-nucleotidase SurE [Clostridia bacterium]MBQ8743515.1 5'/3'-nucleotidase SurE [Clostridia bacterium]
MNILITNDDGYRSEALIRLARWAKKLGSVTVVSPKTEQSGRSQAIEFHKPIEIKKIDLDPEIEAYYVDSTPADCVRFATASLKTKFDLILSGINHGYNIGDDLVYSGTAGAVFEGARLNISGIALSTDTSTYDVAFENIDRVFDFIFKNGLLKHSCIYNVNIPLAAKEIKVTRQGGMYFDDNFTPLGNDMYMQEGDPIPLIGCDLSVDIDAVRNGYISITPISAARTNLEAYEKIKDL